MNHAMLGFLPQKFGLVPGLLNERLEGKLYFIFCNGAAAVCLFFVLSAYVLTRRYFATGDTGILVRGAVKRWPRLMGPIFVTVMVSYALFYFHLYHYAEAGPRSASPWLTEFGNAFLRIFPPNNTVHSIHFRTALQQGTYGVLFRGDWLFDGSFWTMRPELLGSFIAFGAAPLLLQSRQYAIYITLWLLFLLALCLHFAMPVMVAFPVGVGLAALLPHGVTLRRRYAYPALLVALYLLGYPSIALGAYRIFGFLTDIGMPYAYPQIAGAAILIGVIETFPPIRRVFSGSFCAFLGDLSFPVYLLHCLVICSISSWIYLRLGAIPAIISVFAIAIPVSVPLMIFNDWWVAQLNSLTHRLLRPRIGTPPSPPAYDRAERAKTLEPAPSAKR
jgi:peptidoglycan/LPS O-acetylase OafA/YrhL